jgi:hypothetical protein
MPPKSSSSSSSTTRKRKATSPAPGDDQQTTLSSFFAKPKTTPSSASTSKSPSKSIKSVKNLYPKPTGDVTKGKSKGKGRADPSSGGGPEGEVIDLMSEDEEDQDIVEMVEKDTKIKKVKQEVNNKLDDPPMSDSISSSTKPSAKSEPTLFSIFAKPSQPSPLPPKPTPSSSVPNPFHKPSPTKHLLPSNNPTSSSSSSKLAAPPKEYPNLDVDPLLFSPSSIDTSYWPLGRIPYSFLVEACFVRVGGTRKRLAIGRIITNLLRIVIHWDPASLCSAVYL